MPNVLSFLTYALLTTFTPGPNNIMSLCNAGKYGFKKSLPFNLGVAAGFLLVMAASAAFSYALMSSLPAIKPYMNVAGAAYMAYLAVKTLLSKPHSQDGAKNRTTFLAGMLLQFVNPKGVLYGITITSVYLTPYYTSPFALMGFAAFLALITLGSTCSWAAFGSAFQTFIAKHSKAFNIVMAVLLGYCAVSLFL